MKASLLLALTLVALTDQAAQLHLSKATGDDIPADDTSRMVICNLFSVARDTLGTVPVTATFVNPSCAGNSMDCNPARMAGGRIRAPLQEDAGGLHDLEVGLVENSVVRNPHSGVLNLMVRNAGPYTLHLAAQDMRAGRYTLPVEVMGVGGERFRPLRHHGFKATGVVH